MQTIIGCKLPQGITLNGTAGQRITLNGANTSLVQSAAPFGVTNVDDYEWEYLKTMYADFGPFKSHAIFACGTDSVADIAAMGRELAEEKTGFEAMNPDKPAPDMVPADPVQLDQMKAAAESAPRPRKAPAAPADKVATKKLAGK